MSISYAMQTGVSGLRANSTAVGRISENIANANTDGYRRSFVQMVTTSTLSQNGTVAPSGVRAVQGSEISTEGALRADELATLKRRAFHAILDEEEPRLPKVAALIAELRGEIG